MRTHPTCTSNSTKGKEPILPGDSDPPVDDELSSGSSPLPDLSPTLNNAEAEPRKRPLCRSSRFASGLHCRIRREASRDRRHSELPQENMPTGNGGMASLLMFIYPTFGAPPALHLVSFTAVRRLEYMLSSLLDQHRLSNKSMHTT